jgi:hypothetical protein
MRFESMLRVKLPSAADPGQRRLGVARSCRAATEDGRTKEFLVALKMSAGNR